MVFSPMGLHEHAIDLLEVNELFSVLYGLEHGGDTEVSGTTQNSFRRSNDQLYGLLGEGVMTQYLSVSFMRPRYLYQFSQILPRGHSL